MGSSSSRPSSLAPTFARMASWDIKAAKRLLADYREKDLDFGLDAQSLAELCGGDNAHAEAIIDAFGGTNGIVNALAYICGAILVASGAALEKAGLVFDALDFDMTEQISMDEMTIVLLCCARGYCVMSATGHVPSDEELEHVTLQAYRELSKSGGHSITKNEFTKWVLKFLAASPTAVPHAEVTLEDMAVQFGLVVPVLAAKSLVEDVLKELTIENNVEGADEGVVGGVEEIRVPEASVVVASDDPPPTEEGTQDVESHEEWQGGEGGEGRQYEVPMEGVAADESVNASLVSDPLEHAQPEAYDDSTAQSEAYDDSTAQSAIVDEASSHRDCYPPPDEYRDEFQSETPRVEADAVERPASAAAETTEFSAAADDTTDTVINVELTEDALADGDRVEAEAAKRPASAAAETTQISAAADDTTEMVTNVEVTEDALAEGDRVDHEEKALIEPAYTPEGTAVPGSEAVSDEDAGVLGGEPASDSPPDLNAFDTYDYTDQVYDSSNALAPPDPFETPLPEHEALEESALMAAQEAELVEVVDAMDHDAALEGASANE